ncbi:helix-turn-helix transcriptional regulator [Methylobacterium sp. A54F]
MHLYERAATCTGQGPLWHVAGDRTFFAGPLTYNAAHQHGAPVFLAGLHGRFRLRAQGGAWLWCRTAVVPAGTMHELELRGDPVAVLYLEPDGAGPHGLIPLVSGARETDGIVVGEGGEVGPLRALFEDRSAVEAAGPVLGDLLRFAVPRARRTGDARIRCAVEALRARAGAKVPVSSLAARAGLSASRFQHLFTAEVGVPFRRYRAWLRMRAAIGEIVGGANFTQAAHAAGFADQAHFAHDFRRTFGAPASWSLTGVRR